jgi:hypothetical protein
MHPRVQKIYNLISDLPSDLLLEFAIKGNFDLAMVLRSTGLNNRSEFSSIRFVRDPFVFRPRKISAIKLLRQVTGLMLRDAKDGIEGQKEVDLSNISASDRDEMLRELQTHGYVTEPWHWAADDGLPF